MRHLHKDLKEIRNSQKISLDQVSKQTRVPISLFESIEEGSFFQDSSHTRTYVRSFVRMFAKAIKIQDEDIVKALDQYEADQYTGSLHRKYILGKPDQEPEPDQPSTLAKAETTSSPVTTATSVSETPGKAKYRPVIQAPATPPDSLGRLLPNPSNVDWRQLTRKFLDEQQKLSPLSIGLLVATIVIMLLSVVYSTLYDEDSTITQLSPQTSGSVIEAEDTTLSTSTTPLPAPNLLQDTLSIIVYALNDKLAPIKITSDLTQKPNPYWLEKGTGRRFSFVDSIRFDADITKYALIYNGHLISDLNPYLTADNPKLILLTRATILGKPEWGVTGSLSDSISRPLMIE
jgi:cytoskeletal protein RodZ